MIFDTGGIDGEESFADFGAFRGGEPGDADVGAIGAEGLFDDEDDGGVGMSQELVEPGLEIDRRREGEFLLEIFGVHLLRQGIAITIMGG